MQTADFDFDLPPELIAQHPLPQRSASRLLHLDGRQIHDRQFIELPGLLRAGDLLVVNDSRVMSARLSGHKASGGQVEVMIERLLDARRARALIRASKTPRPGSRIILTSGHVLTVGVRDDLFFEVEVEGEMDLADVIAAAGCLPLPPYIHRAPEPQDAERYQTVYARQPGSVAAPTAGLHFDLPLLAALDAAGITRASVTLEVGAGTFLPVRGEDLSAHQMHSERFHIPPDTAQAVAATRARGGRVIAVGTTSLRSLESAADDTGRLTPGAAQTRLFITPGYRFRVVDALITNFHLPRSTLLMLVAALAGLSTIRAAYAHAITQRYRFFSYGDAMFIDPGVADAGIRTAGP